MRRLNAIKYVLKTIVFLVILGTSANVSLAQSIEIDSLKKLLQAHPENDTLRVNYLNELSIEYKCCNMDSALLLANQGLKLSEQLGFLKGEGNTYTSIGNVMGHIGKLDSAIVMYKKAIAIRTELKDFNGVGAVRQNLAQVLGEIGYMSEAIAELEEIKTIYIAAADTIKYLGLLNNLGRNYQDIGEYDKSYAQFMEALRISVYMKKLKIQGIILTNLSTLFLQNQYYDYALLAANEAAIIFKKENFTLGYGTIEGILGNIYFSMEDYEKALTHYQSGEKYAIETGDKIGYQLRLQNMGSTYMAMGNDDSAYYYFRAGMDVSQIGTPTYDYAQNAASLAYLYLNRNVSDSAIYYGLFSQKMFLELGHKNGNLMLNEVLAKAYAMQGKYELAYQFQVTTKEVQDSIVSLDKKNSLQQLKIKYETEKKEADLERLSVEVELYESESEQDQLIIWTTSTIFFLAILAFTFYIRSRKIKVRKNTIELEQTALRAQMNPHFIFNSLNSIQRLYIEGMFDKAADYMADFSRLLRSILENSSKATLSLQEDLKCLELYCRMEQLRTDNLFTYEISVHEDLNPSYINLPPMIIQPFVENAIWHGILPKKKEGKVLVLVRPAGKKIEVVIEDDGVGWQIKPDSNHISKGIELIEKRINQRVKIEHLNPGTRISFKLTIA